MTREQMYEALGEIDERYVRGAKVKKKKALNYKVWGMAAACLCLTVGGAALVGNTIFKDKPDSENVQIPNPLQEVQSLEEMENYLDFKVPILDKEVEAYIVIDGENSKIARIEYTDGSTFNMAHGTGDISGIYGGTLQKEQEIDDIKVSFYEYEGIENTIDYALWEKEGFTYSYAGMEVSVEEIQALMK